MRILPQPNCQPCSKLAVKRPPCGQDERYEEKLMLRSQSDARIKLNVQDTWRCWMLVGCWRRPKSFTWNFKDRKFFEPLLKVIAGVSWENSWISTGFQAVVVSPFSWENRGCVDPTLSDENLLTVTTKSFKQKYEASENVSEKSKDPGKKTKRSLNPSDLRICVFFARIFLGLPNIFVSELPGYWLVNLPPPNAPHRK